MDLREKPRVPNSRLSGSNTTHSVLILPECCAIRLAVRLQSPIMTRESLEYFLSILRMSPRKLFSGEVPSFPRRDVEATHDLWFSY